GAVQAEVFSPWVGLAAGERLNLKDADGSAIVIHAKADDHQSQPIGGAGERVACGVIE
ncbi:MAG: superoxide dismutase family protein, partial [Caulobacteraceae bacterium]|nr:superoxide dismutase family protein [Caulobacteraceae bacterium]